MWNIFCKQTTGITCKEWDKLFVRISWKFIRNFRNIRSDVQKFRAEKQWMHRREMLLFSRKNCTVISWVYRASGWVSRCWVVLWRCEKSAGDHVSCEMTDHSEMSQKGLHCTVRHFDWWRCIYITSRLFCGDDCEIYCELSPIGLL